MVFRKKEEEGKIKCEEYTFGIRERERVGVPRPPHQGRWRNSKFEPSFSHMEKEDLLIYLLLDKRAGRAN